MEFLQKIAFAQGILGFRCRQSWLCSAFGCPFFKCAYGAELMRNSLHFAACLLGFTCLAQGATVPRFFGASPGSLERAKARLAAGDKEVTAAVKRLVKDADKTLSEVPPSVMDKTKTPPSGNKHDYISLAPYFWPDPSKRNGLPYVRKDGKVNPESKDPAINDSTRVMMMGKCVETLALAYYFTGKQDYAAHAAKFVRTWFLDPQTRMTPHLNFGQAVLGKNEGRGEGILEGRNIAIAADAVGLLAGSEAWKSSDQAELDKWLGSYLRWLLTSPIGHAERGAKNNHGSWFDAQVARLALCLGHPEETAKFAKDAMRDRVAVQIGKDGREPLELARTASFSYSWFNMEALSELATMGQYVGVDLWHFSNAKTGGLSAAYRYMLPYVDVPPTDWPHEQIKEKKEKDFLHLLHEAALALDAPELEAVASKYDDHASARYRLLFLK